MKILKILLVMIVSLLLFSCSDKNLEEDFQVKKDTWFKSWNSIFNNYKKTKPKEVVYLENKSNTWKEKVEYIKDKMEHEKEVFKDRNVLNRSLDATLDYLDKEKKLSKKKNNSNNDKKDSQNLKVEDLDKSDNKKEIEDTKVLVEELIEEQIEGSMEKAYYEWELEKVEENYEKAIDKFKEAFEASDNDEDRAQALAWEASVYEEMWNDEQAEETYEEALGYDEDNVDANIWDAKYDIDDNLLDEAEENLENIDTDNIQNEQAIEVEVLRSLINTLKWEYKESDKTLLNAIENYWEHIDIYMLLIQNNYFFSLFYFMNASWLPIDQTADILETYKANWLNYYNKAISLDPNRVYSYFYYGASKYLLWDKDSWMNYINQWASLIDNDSSLNTQEKKDEFLDYVDVIRKINTYNTTFDYTPEQFDVIIQEKKWIFEKFYRMIDEDRLKLLTVDFEH